MILNTKVADVKFYLYVSYDYSLLDAWQQTWDHYPICYKDLELSFDTLKTVVTKTHPKHFEHYLQTRTEDILLAQHNRAAKVFNFKIISNKVYLLDPTSKLQKKRD